MGLQRDSTSFEFCFYIFLLMDSSLLHVQVLRILNFCISSESQSELIFTVYRVYSLVINFSRFFLDGQLIIGRPNIFILQSSIESIIYSLLAIEMQTNFINSNHKMTPEHARYQNDPIRNETVK